jgi:hypothetical protein
MRTARTGTIQRPLAKASENNNCSLKCGHAETAQMTAYVSSYHPSGVQTAKKGYSDPESTQTNGRLHRKPYPFGKKL